MNVIRCLLVLLVMQTLCLAGETAYEALRHLSSLRGQKTLEQVLELHGAQGTPQPAAWRVLLGDPLARGGIREFEIVGGKITSERAPVASSAGVDEAATIDFQKLNLDSSGVFNLAVEEARKRKLGFDSVDYLLRRGANGPEWVLRLFAEGKGNLGSLHVAADSGKVVLVEGLEATQDKDHADQLKAPTEAVRRTLNKFGNNLRNGLQRTGESVRRFLER